MMYLHHNPIISIIFIVAIISPLVKTTNGSSPCQASWFCIYTDNGPLLSMWFGFWIAMFVGAVANLIFTYIGNIIQDTVASIFLCYAIDQDNGAVRPGKLVKLLQKMPACANPMHAAAAEGAEDAQVQQEQQEQQQQQQPAKETTETGEACEDEEASQEEQQAALRGGKILV
jgi:hypothetical protein